MNKIGALIPLRPETDVDVEFKKMRDIGCECCQVTVWDMSLYSDETAKALTTASEKYGIEISTLWTGWSGPRIWDFTSGQHTLGLVPEVYRLKRTEDILKGADFAVKIGVKRIATHVGYLPENPCDSRYYEILATLTYIARECKMRGLCFLFETGQETPTTLLRTIEDINLDNVGINMDTANLILYGKANSADAITVFGKYVMDTHIKDGLYPTCGRKLGKEVKVGEGMANLPEVIKRLKEAGYQGNYIIEREIRGDQQTKDIKDTIDYLKAIL